MQLKYRFILCLALMGLTALLLLPGTAHAQAGIPFYEFSAAALDYPTITVNGQPASLQATFGQAFATVEPPTNAGQSLAEGGFGETYVPFAYIGQIALESYVGNANPGVTYGKMTGIPFTAQTSTAASIREGVLPNRTFFADATGKVKILSSLNPAFAQSLAIKGPIWLRQSVVLTPPADPVNGFPSASFHLPGGDATNDNIVDVGDFGVLVNAYLGSVTVPGSGYDATADFNQDGIIDISDFGIVVNNFTLTGDP